MEKKEVIQEPNGDIFVTKHRSGRIEISQPDFLDSGKDRIWICNANLEKLITILKKIK